MRVCACVPGEEPKRENGRQKNVLEQWGAQTLRGRWGGGASVASLCAWGQSWERREGGWAHVGRPWVRWAPGSCHLAARRVHEAGSKAVAESEEVLGVRRPQEGPFSVAV